MPSYLCSPGEKLGPNKKNVTSKKVGLQFPVGYVAFRLATGKYAKRVDVDVPIYMTAVLEYLATEVLELAGNAAKDDNKTTIKPEHIQIPATKDEDLSKLFGDLTIAKDDEGSTTNTHNDLLLPNKTTTVING